jgi:hypothetical protein
MQKEEIEIDGIYRHYKTGGEYKILYKAKLQTKLPELDMVDCVVYVAISDGLIWVRPVADFFDEVEFEGNLVNRFTKI